MSTGAAISRKSTLTCGASGVRMCLRARFSTRALTHGIVLGPYGVTVLLTLGTLLCCFLWKVYFMQKPVVGGLVRFSGFFGGTVSGHSLGLLGGATWTARIVVHLLAENFTGVAISYAMGQTAPIVAALWGIFAWEEFSGANRRATPYLALTSIFNVMAILLVGGTNLSIPAMVLGTQ
jgi:glucose uptake protein